MMPPHTILIATIGTRDLSFQVEGTWWNVGDKTIKFGDRTTPAETVYESIATEPKIVGDPGDCFRSRTAFLLENWQQFNDRLKPVMLGGLIEQESAVLARIYLIATDQIRAEKRYSDSDTCHTAAIIARWVQERYNIPCHLILLGQQGENPANFDAMIRWSKQAVWSEVRSAIEQQSMTQPIERLLISPKGGVGQCSDALRVTALTGFVEQTLEFCDFVEDTEANRRGEFSVPHLSDGSYYLWELTQRQAIALMERYDYLGVQKLLATQLQSHHDATSDLAALLDTAEVWNQANFSQFRQALSKARNLGIPIDTIPSANDWWWSAYESAYLSVIRLEQGNTVEAFFHSFRAIEGAINDWVRLTYKEYLREESGRATEILRSILNVLPGYQSKFNNMAPGKQLRLYGDAGFELLREAKPEARQHPAMQQFFDVVKDKRNQTMHRLLGLTAAEIFAAWEVKDANAWQTKVLACLNFISGKSFAALRQASRMPTVHQELVDRIQRYYPDR